METTTFVAHPQLCTVPQIHTHIHEFTTTREIERERERPESMLLAASCFLYTTPHPPNLNLKSQSHSSGNISKPNRIQMKPHTHAILPFPHSVAAAATDATAAARAANAARKNPYNIISIATHVGWDMRARDSHAQLANAFNPICVAHHARALVSEILSNGLRRRNCYIRAKMRPTQKALEKEEAN